MPELPEVETIKRSLAHEIVNKKIKNVWVEPSFKKKISPNTEKFVEFLVGKKFTHVARRTKMLIFTVTKDLAVLTHLKMTGQLVYSPRQGQAIGGGHNLDEKKQPNRFTRVRFDFADGSTLYFNDMRKFGFMKLLNSAELRGKLAKYGPDPFDKSFTFACFQAGLSKRQGRRIKTVLLDQTFVAGIGNIYADEICFAARVHPEKKVKALDAVEIKNFFLLIKKILAKAVKYHGTSVNTYVDGAGRSGGYQRFLNVYDRKGEKCHRCGSIIQKIKIGGRSSSFCPRCQTLAA
ncbi:DNA-formamidopyrimidine glycosylase [Candidatus Falkowbacteria bacterium RIFOXYC2_FULL_48_21]|uniref:DNA-formamidopyrimidine glycosylase n=1 Tax=Candidatus Falkowbacteria bacterium RIFOXYC2_FULL_48_21 TaxID=1798005 RepID=A0A1F5TH08_9BACT|nr:MAG: DNA-formamidopyrimidine glycosylase [Candidatus Falkowbacteria bacterium RIFOXYC2_FULL_48_21]